MRDSIECLKHDNVKCTDTPFFLCSHGATKYQDNTHDRSIWAHPAKGIV